MEELVMFNLLLRGGLVSTSSRKVVEERGGPIVDFARGPFFSRVAGEAAASHGSRVLTIMVGLAACVCRVTVATTYTPCHCVYTNHRISQLTVQ